MKKSFVFGSISITKALSQTILLPVYYSWYEFYIDFVVIISSKE